MGILQFIFGACFILAAESVALGRSIRALDDHAVVLVHGWGRSPRKPERLWRQQIQPYTDLTILKNRFERLGFKHVHIVEYDDLGSLDSMASAVASQMHKIISDARNPHLTLDVVGHSMGQFVAAKAILDQKFSNSLTAKLSDRVRIFIGLAGIIRGQDELYPCQVFPNQCGGGGDLQPFYVDASKGSKAVRTLFAEHWEVLNKIKKCSVYSSRDEIVNSPFDAASFRGLGMNEKNFIDLEIDYQGSKFHNDVKDSEQIFEKVIEHCYRDFR